jgi:hypothetical protein
MRYTISEAKKLIEDKIIKNGFTIHYRKSLSGSVCWSNKTCDIPEIKTRKSLFIGAHELFHCLRERKGKVYINEFKAEKFAGRYMRHLGFNVPRVMLYRAKRYISYKISKAFTRGMRQDTLDKNVKAWLR